MLTLSRAPDVDDSVRLCLCPVLCLCLDLDLDGRIHGEGVVRGEDALEDRQTVVRGEARSQRDVVALVDTRDDAGHRIHGCL